MCLESRDFLIFGKKSENSLLAVPDVGIVDQLEHQ